MKKYFKFKLAVMSVCLFVFLSFPVFAKRDHPERWYQQQWCQQQGGGHRGRVLIY
jgi:hypothetical protein